jgi:hypothetical protein
MPSTDIPNGGDPNHKSETALQTLGGRNRIEPTGNTVHKPSPLRHEFALPQENLEATKAYSPVSIESVRLTIYGFQFVTPELEEDWEDLIEEITSDMDLGSDPGSDLESDGEAHATDTAPILAHATDTAPIVAPASDATRIPSPAPGAVPVASSTADAGHVATSVSDAVPTASPPSVTGPIVSPTSVTPSVAFPKTPEVVIKQYNTLFSNFEIKETFEESIRATLSAEQFEAVLSYLTGDAALDDASPNAKLVSQLVEEINKSHENVEFPSLEEIYGKQLSMTQVEAEITTKPVEELPTTLNAEQERANADQAGGTQKLAPHVVMDIKY